MTRLTWEKLDRYETPDEIAGLLRQHGVRGKRGISGRCPLAKATGWYIGNYWAGLRGNAVCHQLTPAESCFVARFDAGEYLDLEEE